MLTPDRFSSHTLARHPQGRAVARILAAALQAVEPGQAVRSRVHRQGSLLWVDGQAYDLNALRRIHVLAAGKAAPAMARALVELLGDRISRGLLIAKHSAEPAPPGFDLQLGGHPIPDGNSILAGEKALALVSGLQADDLLICLLSGGGSALMTLPHAGLQLEDLQALTSALLAGGGRVDEINLLRRHLDRLKGGQLAHLAAPARVVSLILSDVVGSPLEAIASGPTAPDPTTRQEALAVLEKYHLEQEVPGTLRRLLAALPETPKPGDPLFQVVQNVVAGSNAQAGAAACGQAKREGFHALWLGDDWQGEARLVGMRLSRQFAAPPRPRPFCLAAGGETTVTLRGAGRGGRNQELALAAVDTLAGMPGALLVSLATDGEDGPTDAAGAVVSSETLRRGLAIGLSPQTFLDQNDSYPYFESLGDLLKPGPSGTNVNDLFFLFGF